MPPAVETWSLNHWIAREVPLLLLRLPCFLLLCVKHTFSHRHQVYPFDEGPMFTRSESPPYSNKSDKHLFKATIIFYQSNPVLSVQDGVVWLSMVSVCVCIRARAKLLQSYPTLCNPMSMGFSRQEYWRGLPYSPLGDTPNPGIEPGFPVVEANSLPLAEAQNSYRHLHN